MTTDPSTDAGTTDTQDDGALLVAGLGASAGGVEALEAFFAGLPEIDGVAFVVILHLAPDEESRLADVLEAGLPLPVTQVTEAVTIERGHVYVIPPGKNLLAEGRRLVLEPIEEARVRRRPIDHFFRTLAAAYGERAVGVVLSGTGANGTVGVRALKEAGGLILAQDPDDAAFDEMPRSAIASGVVDMVGPAGALAAEVVAYAHRLHRVQLGTPTALAEDGAKALQGILSQLRARTGHDFAHYKRATVLRRLDRRLHVTGADSLDAYLDHLRENAAEAEALLDDLLISVTNFFRDSEAFEVLERAVPRLFEGKGPDAEVRVWVPGCATGEEAYSVAMLLLEHASTLAEPPRVQVFATDLSDEAVRTARTGAYPESIEADVSVERLRRFFSHENGRYRVTEPLREAVLFAPHSLLADPPFSRLDLVTCRNLLIYFQRDLQQQALAVFHYALRPGGLLFLGTSESPGGGMELFGVVDKRARLYRRLGVETPPPALPRVPRVLYDPTPGGTGAPPVLPRPEHEPSEAARVHRALREETAPPSVLVGENGDVVHVSEGAERFLQISSGAPTRALAKLLRPELRAAAQMALIQARREGRTAESAPVPFGQDGEAQAVTVRARPAPDGDLVQLVFDVLPPALAAAVPTADADEVLAESLRQTQEQLQVSVEEFETSREELRAQNEELQSINEELRSTAEELETSKEEAQSMSEELRTVNDELKHKVDETARAKGDLENLVTSTEIATLFLDRQLRIQRFTPRVRDLFHVLASDVGRPLGDLAQKFGGARLVEDAEAVLDRLEVTEREVESEDGRWYLVHTRPYRSTEDRIDGVVVTFVDITRRKADEAELQASADRAAFRAALADALRTIADPVAVQAEAARALGEHLGASRVHYAEVEPDGEHAVVARGYARGVPDGSGRYDLTDYPALIDDARAGRTLVVADIPDDDRLSPSEKKQFAELPVEAIVVVPLVKDSRLVAVFAVHDDAPHAWTAAEVALIEETAERTWSDVERACAEQALRTSETRYRTLFESIDEGFCVVEMVEDEAGTPVSYRFVETNPAFEQQSGLAGAEGKTIHELVPGVEGHWVETYGRVAATGERARFIEESPAMGLWFEVDAFRIGAPEDRRVAILFTDITQRKRDERKIRELNASLEARVAERTEQVRRLSGRLAVAEHEERRRIALVLHDDLQQQLAGLAITHHILWRSPGSDEDRALREKADEILDGATALTRTLASELSPPSLESEDLGDTLRWLAERKLDLHQLDVTVEVDGTCEVPGDGVRTLLYNTVRELLFNVVKHAGTARATVRAHRDGPAVVVEVEDEGDGFDADAPGTGGGGLGLFSVRERIEMAGGHLELDSERGRGTRVTITVPVAEEGAPTE